MVQGGVGSVGGGCEIECGVVGWWDGYSEREGGLVLCGVCVGGGDGVWSGGWGAGDGLCVVGGVWYEAWLVCGVVVRGMQLLCVVWCYAWLLCVVCVWFVACWRCGVGGVLFEVRR